MNNAYIACASTGKAAVTLGGTTVHSAFCLTTSRVTKLLSTENLQAHRNMFVGVKAVFIDEISMMLFFNKSTTDCSRLLAYTTNLLETFTLHYVEISDSFHLYEQLHVILCRSIN